MVGQDSRPGGVTSRPLHVGAGVLLGAKAEDQIGGAVELLVERAGCLAHGQSRRVRAAAFVIRRRNRDRRRKLTG